MKSSLLLFLNLLIGFSVQAGTLVPEEFEFQNRTRRAVIYIPDNYDGSKSYPLVVNTHGASWEVNSWIEERPTYNEIADRDSFIVIYPQGLPIPFFSYVWNVGYGPAQSVNDVDFIDLLIEHCKSEYNIDERRMYMAGFSQGGMLAYQYACTRPGVFAAIASASGSITSKIIENCSNYEALPIMHIHGTNDEVVFYPGVPIILRSVPETIAFWRNKNGCINEFVETDIPDTVPDNMKAKRLDYSNCTNDRNKIIFIRVLNGRHDWYSARNGPENDVNNSQITWEFFKQNSLPEEELLTSTSDNIKSGPVLYPNPAHQSFKINMGNNEIETVEVIDQTGQIVLNQNVLSNEEIGVKHLSAGYYIARLSGKQTNLSISLIIY